MADASQAAGVSTRTGWNWLQRYREAGEDGLEPPPLSDHDTGGDPGTPPGPW